VIDNYKSTVDVAGRPPKSFEAYVLGGNELDIAQAILSKKAAGIEPYGTKSVTVKDDAGYDQLIRYTPATQITVRLRFTITTDTRFPVDGGAQLKTAAISYIGGEDADGTLYVGLNMGADVITSRLIAFAYGVDGITDVKIEISTDGSTWTTGNLAVAQSEVAQTSANLITVVQL
jgi:hypothetical protein